MRKYYLSSEDGGIAWDKTYSLVFTFDAQMRVLIVKEFEQPYKTPDVEEVQPKDFDRHTVRGIPLREIVLNKLDEILPKFPSEGVKPGIRN